jgi:NOL1/NOP2/fmu family ribosome biogenesis protein
MSLAINTTTPEGIVLAADSRQYYRNQKGVSRIGSDSASKLFLINNRIGVATTGLAFLQENGIPKNISKFIEQFKREVDVEKLSVKDVAEKLYYLFDKKLNWQEQLDKLPDQIKDNFTKQGFEIVEIKKEKYNVKFKIKDKAGNIKEGGGGIDGLVLFVAGYNTDGSHEVYNVYVPGENIKRRDSTQKGMEYGANWIGQTDVVSRIIKGWDPRIFNVPFINETIQSKSQNEVEKQLNSLEYAINWGAMPLQDAVDFSVLAIQTTSAIQRFSDGVQADPGDIPGVGGPIDVLVLTPDGPKWIKQKELKVE